MTRLRSFNLSIKRKITNIDSFSVHNLLDIDSLLALIGPDINRIYKVELVIANIYKYRTMEL